MEPNKLFQQGSVSLHFQGNSLSALSRVCRVDHTQTQTRKELAWLFVRGPLDDEAKAQECRNSVV